jgi:hypothetical protein
MSLLPNKSLTEWLLDSDPSIRWQVMRDLTGAPAEEVAAERARIATEGTGAGLLALQATDERVAEAIELVASKRDGDGCWRLETRYPGVMPVDTDEDEGRPSRWITLRAIRVLDWYSALD